MWTIILCFGMISLSMTIDLKSNRMVRADTVELRQQAHEMNHQILLQQLRLYWKCRAKASETSPRGNSVRYCPLSFDGWSCWDVTEAGQQASIPCPSSNPSSYSTDRAFRNCDKTGKWELDADKKDLVDYSSCSYKQNPKLKLRLRELISGLSNVEMSTYDDAKVSAAYEQCMEELTVRTHPLPDRYCAGTFDGWSCWNDTAPGETAYVTCPNFIPGFLPERFAYKVCNNDGTWYRHPDTNRTWSNYTTCVDHEDFIFRQKINNLYVAGYSVSVVALLISLAIFFYFRKLHGRNISEIRKNSVIAEGALKCTRITIHKNLFLSFVMNNIMWIIWYSEVVQHADVLMANSTGCQVLHILVHYFLLCNYFWMFCEGLHLHTLMLFAFVQENKLLRLFLFIGWGVPFIIICIYSSVRASMPEQTQYCWIEYTSLQWIISGPVCLSMLLNVVFLVNIVRVLVTKLRAINSPETHQTKKAVRATLILLPLLGLHYLLTPFRPEPRSSGEAIYETTSAIVTSFQGLCVALLFCFFNGEVLAMWRKKWTRSRLTRGKEAAPSYAATTLSEVTAL